MNIDITRLFVCLDDFCKLYEMAVKANTLPSGKSRNRSCKISLSEMLLIEVMFHLSDFKCFKHYYLFFICTVHRNKFLTIPSYQRFVALKKQMFMPITILLHSLFGEETGLYFVDSTSLKVCHNKRINRHKIFKGMAERGKTTMGWFYGLKLHLIINHKGEIMSVKITAGNTDDRKALGQITKNLTGKCYADKGYVGNKIFADLWKKGLHLITGIRKNMKNKLMPRIDKILLRKRFLIETVFGQLKTTMNIEHSRHRSVTNACINIIAALVAYSYKASKPKIKANLLLP